MSFQIYSESTELCFDSIKSKFYFSVFYESPILLFNFIYFIIYLFLFIYLFIYLFVYLFILDLHSNKCTIS